MFKRKSPIIHTNSTPTLPDHKLGNNPLILAASRNDIKAVYEAIEAKKELNACNTLHDTALHLAASNGYTEIVDALLQAKAEVNVPNYNATTPLMLAAYYGHLDIVTLLLRAMAKINITNFDDQSALDLALEGQQKTKLATIHCLLTNKAAIRNHAALFNFFTSVNYLPGDLYLIDCMRILCQHLTDNKFDSSTADAYLAYLKELNRPCMKGSYYLTMLEEKYKRTATFEKNEETLQNQDNHEDEYKPSSCAIS